MNLRSITPAATAIGALAWFNLAQGAVIDFATQQPVVVVDQLVALSVEITYQAGEFSSLFSYGVAVLPEPGASQVLGIGVEVPAPLDFNGILGPGAWLVARSDFLGAKGTVDLSANPTGFYSEKLLATFTLRFTEPGSYPFRLDFFNTLGPTEDIFVTGDGAVLDDHITFGSTIVHVVIPEPASGMLFFSALAGLALRRRRDHSCIALPRQG